MLIAFTIASVVLSVALASMGWFATFLPFRLRAASFLAAGWAAALGFAANIVRM